MSSPDDAVKKTEEKATDDRPTLSLQSLGYGFDENGELRSLKLAERYVFKQTDDDEENQRRYEDLGSVITQHIYGLLETQCHLRRHRLPVGVADGEPNSFFFATEDALVSTDKLLILIHGSGVVRAGQWSRRLIINDNVDCGSQLPFIEKAVDDGYQVLVLNTNHNSVLVDGRQVDIAGNSSPESHAVYVWKHFVSRAKSKHIAIIAHSYGGVVTTHMAKSLKQDFVKRVFAIAFTDSVHCLLMQEAGSDLTKFYRQNARNWVTSSRPLDEPLASMKDDAPQVSAGHVKHEWTSSSSFASIFKFLDEKYSERTET